MARIYQTIMLGSVAGLLAGCMGTGALSVEEAALTQADAAPADEEVVPTVPELPSLFFNWDLTNSTMIAPPVDIQTAAIEACRKRGYDTSYMIHISIEGDQAISEFGCRGAD